MKQNRLSEHRGNHSGVH
uniref:Uncharacterized protein n=1 Tax=Anguilla anguilla TaxID=7936 RepID=A0A0E9V1G3_ANGAN